jgi:hypothetical protein
MLTPELPRGEVNPYEPPQVDSQTSAPASLPRRPSAGDVALLLVLQAGLSLLTRQAASFMASGAVGDFLGAVVLGLLRGRRPRPWQMSFRISLALWGTLIWGVVGGALLVLARVAFLPGDHVVASSLFLGIAQLLLYYFGSTLPGLWLGSWLVRRQGTPK